jgi:hypothetical protein
MSDADPAKILWTSQPWEPVNMSEAAIGARARKLDATIWWRDAREHVAAAAVVAFFGYYAVTHVNPVAQAGAAAIVLAAVFVSWRLWSLSSSGKDDGLTQTWLDRYRAALARQRDTLRSVWRWYALPFAPGLAAMIAARHVYPEFKLDEVSAWAGMAWPVAFTGAIFAGVVWLNLWAAGKLQKEIDELDRANQNGNT